MSEIVEQNSWQQPMQCWGCGRNNICKDCPQRGDKARTTHNVQQAAIVEDMGRNVPRIYVVVDNK
jgi:hypothetical protein